jgi:hypothetical protein
LPGPPKYFEAEFRSTRLYGITRVRVFINGEKAIDSDTGDFKIPKADEFYPDFFVYGKNRIVVRVTKAAGCDANYPIGIYFYMRGIFDGDKALPKSPADDKYVRVPYNSSFTLNVNRTFSRLRNWGPSGVYAGRLAVGVLSSAFGRVDVSGLNAEGPFKQCELKMYGPADAKITCNINRWAPGNRGGVQFQAKVYTPSEFTTKKIYISAGLDSNTPDSDRDNNRYYQNIVVCSPDATDPKCP